MWQPEVVYNGRWTDWSHGVILGDRITVTTSTGKTLIALIAVFDTIVGMIAWNIISFIIHHFKATSEPRDELHHSLQKLLRSFTDPFSFVAAALTSGWKHRNRNSNARLRAALLSLLPISISIMFSVAGIASTRIASTGDVLIRGGNCGSYVSPNSSLIDEIDSALDLYAQAGVNLALSNSYAQNCYCNPLHPQIGQISSGVDCETFVRKSLNFTVAFDNECPFEQACSVPDQDIIRLDTGFLDSHHDFGQNQPPENRVLFRKVTTCSPLTSRGFSNNSFYDVPELRYLGNVSVYSYGKNMHQPARFGVPQTLPSENATFVYGWASYIAAETAYYLMVASTTDTNGETESKFTPLPEVSSDPEAPISLIFLANRAFYTKVVTDPWFNATSSQMTQATVNGTTIPFEIFLNDNPGSVLACKEQAQFCNPNTPEEPRCTDLDSWYTWGSACYPHTGFNESAFLDIGLNEMQLATAMTLHTATTASQQFEVVNQLGPTALLASSYLYEQDIFWSSPVATNQWQIEVSNWFGVGLALMQRLYVGDSRPPTEEAIRAYFEPFTGVETVQGKMCDSQKIRSTAYQSFSVLGLALNFVLGSLIGICGLVIAGILPRLHTTGKLRNPTEQQGTAHWSDEAPSTTPKQAQPPSNHWSEDTEAHPTPRHQEWNEDTRTLSASSRYDGSKYCGDVEGVETMLPYVDVTEEGRQMYGGAWSV